MSYIGQRPVVGRYIKLDQISSGFNGSNTGFSMTAGSQAVFPGTARNLLLSLGGVIQEPDTDFTISGSTLTFTTPPVANTTFFGVIYGDMQATGTPSDGTVLPASIASSGHFKIPQLTVNEDGADVDFRVEGDTEANLLFVDASTDRIGIGTSSPSSLFNVDGGSANNVIEIDGTGRYRGFEIHEGGTRKAYFQHDATDNKAILNTAEGILTFATGDTERMRLDSSGNLLIGSTSSIGANYKLQAYHANDCRMYLANTTAASSQEVNLQFAPANSVTGAMITCVSEEDFSTTANRTARLTFSTRKDGTLAERMRIDSSGNVGIGTTTLNRSDAGRPLVQFDYSGSDGSEVLNLDFQTPL